VWALARLHVTGGGDATGMNVLVTNSHDGSSAVQAAVTPVRVVCQNILTWGLSRARRTYSIRHTEKLQTRLIEARRVLELTVATKRASSETAVPAYATGARSPPTSARRRSSASRRRA
jgi:hypothetical protein